MRITKRQLRRIIREAVDTLEIPAVDEIEEWWEYMTPGAMKAVAAKTQVGLNPKRWNGREWESVINYYVQVEMGDPRGWQRGRNV